MDIILQTIITYAIEIIALVLITLFGILGSCILKKIEKNKNLENISKAIDLVIRATQETVRRLQQTLVDDFKEFSENGKLTQEQIDCLKQKTQIITKEQLGVPILESLELAKIDITSLITNTAEAYINKIKTSE